jgi:hypothetical protein
MVRIESMADIADLHMTPAEQAEASRLSKSTRDPTWNDVGDEDDLLDEPRKPNTGMLQALAKIAELTKDMNPKKDPTDFLREAREGAMYGLVHDD